MTRKTTRRDFLKHTTLAAGVAAGTQLVGGPYLMAGPAPSRTLNVAVVGGGGMGGYAVGQARNERFVALAEIDDGRIAEILKGLDKSKGEPKVYYDYRKMIDECHKDIDVVLVSTPDHHHAPAAIRAIHRGKHAFCQKPLAHNIYECRALAEAAKQNKVLTQMGNQGHCGEGYRRLVEFIWGGAIGNVIETHSIFARDFGGSGGIPAGQADSQGLALGRVARPRPLPRYHDGLHPFSWRSWRQFGTGTLGDMACHVMDGVIWSLKLVEATKFSIECLAQKEGSAEMFPKSNVVKFEFPARGNMPPVKVFTYDNSGQKPEIIKNLEKETKRTVRRWHDLRGGKGHAVHRHLRRRHPTLSRVAAPVVRKSAQDAAAGPRRPHRGPLLGDQERRHAGLELRRLFRPLDRVHPHRPVGDVGRRRQEARMGRGWP